MYAQLGNYKFEQLIGFESLTKTSAEKFAVHDVIEGKPIIQHVGSELDEYQVSFMLHSRFCVPEDEIRVLSGLKSTAQILPFISGVGEFKGNFVIESIDEDTYKTDANGSIIEAVVSMVLREYVSPNRLDDIRQKDISNAFATNLQRVVPLRSATLSLSAGSSVLLSQREAVSEANAVIAAANSLETNPSKFQQVFNSIKGGVDRFKEHIADVNDKFQKYQSVKQMVQDADAVLQAVLFDAEAMKESAQNMDLGGTIQNGKNFGSSTGNMQRAFGPLKAFTAGRGVLS